MTTDHIPDTRKKVPAAGSPVQRPAGRPMMEQEDAAVKLATKMAKAAGPQRADTMVRACYMLLCTAALVKDPEGYFEWLEKRNADA